MLSFLMMKDSKIEDVDEEEVKDFKDTKMWRKERAGKYRTTSMSRKSLTP